MNPGRGIWFLPLALAVLVFLLFGEGYSEESVQVIMPCRFNLVPWTLDSIRKILARDLEHPVSLIIRPITGPNPTEDFATDTFYLLEEGFSDGMRQAGLASSSWELDLYWVLACNKDYMPAVASAPPSDLNGFFALLRKVREKNPEMFPWFESLYSANTVLRLKRSFEADEGEESTTMAVPVGSGTTRRFRRSPIRILHAALDAKFLNPLSIEADEGMAFDVFEARDTVFSTLWVTDEFFESPLSTGIVSSLTREIGFFPFPCVKGSPRIPRTRFTLWAFGSPARGPLPKRSAGRGASPEKGFGFEDLMGKDELRWQKKSFGSFYDRLVQGEF